MQAQELEKTSAVDAYQRVRIVLLDDNDGIRSALVEFLQTDPSFEVVGSSASADEGVRLIAEVQPDVALVDVRLAGGGGDRATREALRRSPSTRVVGFSAASDRDAVLGMFRAGAIGFVDKGSAPQQLIDAIRAAFDGRHVISSDISGEIAAELADRLEAESLESQEAMSRRARIEEALTNPAAMQVVFQPIFDLSSDGLVGFEALSRFHGKPRRPPDEWFEEAASVGLGDLLEAEAIRRAVEQLPDLPAWAFVAVNVSPEFLHTSAIQTALEDAPGDRIVLELTEHAVVDDYAALARVLDELRGRGMRVAVDDAGAGYASLRHIVRLAPDIIKLDAELTSGIETDPTRRALASALISFATETNETIVAEGVETTEELSALQALGVPFGQGFLLGRPLPLRAQTRTPAHLEDAESYGAIGLGGIDQRAPVTPGLQDPRGSL